MAVVAVIENDTFYIKGYYGLLFTNSLSSVIISISEYVFTLSMLCESSRRYGFVSSKI
jgi:hypothetical protein